MRGSGHIKGRVFKANGKKQLESPFFFNEKEPKGQSAASLLLASVRVLLGQPNSAPGHLNLWESPAGKGELKPEIFNLVS